MSSTTSPSSHCLEQIALRYDTDKALHIHYLRNYEKHFKNLVEQNVRLLELGVKNGGSLLLWRDYFPRGQIVGIDIDRVCFEDQSGRCSVFQGSQQDTNLLDRVAAEAAPDGFDIIIDDCSHIGTLSRVSFWHLFDRHLKTGGTYVIEDWGTGYWDSWVDGVRYKRAKGSFNFAAYRFIRIITRLQQFPLSTHVPLLQNILRTIKATVVRRQFHAHGFGMVAFIQELIDELGTADIHTGGGGPNRPSRFKAMVVYPSHVFVTKA